MRVVLVALFEVIWLAVALMRAWPIQQTSVCVSGCCWSWGTPVGRKCHLAEREMHISLLIGAPWTLLKVWDSVFLISISSLRIRRPLTSEHDTRNSWESCWNQQEWLSLHSCSLTWTHADITQHSSSSHSSWWGGWQQRERKENSLPLCVVLHQTQLHHSEVWVRISL